MSRKPSDTGSITRKKSDQISDNTQTSVDESKTDHADDADKDRKSILIIKCKPSGENVKSTNLSIGSNTDHQAESSCSIRQDNSHSGQLLDDQNEATIETVSEDKIKKKKHLHFIDEAVIDEAVIDEAVIDEAVIDEAVSDVVDPANAELDYILNSELDATTPLPEAETELGEITTIENEDSHQLDRTSSAELKPSISAIPDDIKVDVATDAKDNISTTDKFTQETAEALLNTLLDNTLASLGVAEEFNEESDKANNLRGYSEMSMESTDSESYEITNKVLVGDLFKLLYLKALKGYAALRIENNILHKKVAHYFNKRHMGFAFVESGHPAENYNKYVQRLEELDRLRLENQVRREYLEHEIKVMVRRNEQLSQTADKDFEDLMNRELEIGSGLIFTKSNKQLSDGVLHNIVNNQRNKLLELKQMRVWHIKFRNAIALKNQKLQDMERLDGDLTRFEYDRLKTLNHTYWDKIEERDLELAKVRKQCIAASTALSHMREKTNSVEREMREIAKESKIVQAKSREARIEVNKIRTLRDKCRKKTYSLKEESGLLANNKLLMDMELCIKEVKRGEDELERQKRKHELMNKKLHWLKFNYDREYDHMVFLRQMQPRTKANIEAEKVSRRQSSRNRSFYKKR